MGSLSCDLLFAFGELFLGLSAFGIPCLETELSIHHGEHEACIFRTSPGPLRESHMAIIVSILIFGVKCQSSISRYLSRMKLYQ